MVSSISDLSDDIGGPPISLIAVPPTIPERPPVLDSNLPTKLIISPPLDAEPPKPTGTLLSYRPLILERKRRNSIASSSSSHNSRLSNSPFLSAPLTSGTCIVCSKKDLPPVNRLARCSHCSSLYHQSCHSPHLTKAILEEAADNWICRDCKLKQETATLVTAPEGGVKRRSSGLSVTLKRSEVRGGDERVLEEQVMVNKSSFSNLLQKHAQWKSPTALKVKDVERFEMATTSTGIKLKDSTPSKDVSRPSSQSASQVDSSTLLTPKPSTSVSKSPQPQPDTPNDLTFQEVSSAEAVPSIKPPPTTTAIPASQPSQPTQLSPNLLAPFEPTSPLIIRSRHRARKRDLVISDSEDESSAVPKRQKLGISPRAAMKSAPSSRAPLTKPAPLKLPMMSGDKSRAKKSAVKWGSSVMARKSGSIVSESRSPTEERAEFISRGNKETTLRSPISPIQSGINRILRRHSPLPSVRPDDPGASQQYSLRLLLTHNTADDSVLASDADPPGYYSTPYPISLSRAKPARPPSPEGKRSQSKRGFDILSLVPNDAVPVLEDGKLAFREGSYDIRTGHLKRGARKFKVGKYVPGE